MSDRLNKFIALPAGQKGLLLHAWLILGWYRFLIAVRPLSRIVGGLEQHAGSFCGFDVSPQQQEQARIVGKLVAAAAAVTPWQSRCLLQVLVVQRLLAKRDIPGVFSIGAYKASNLRDREMEFKAHAWLQCGNIVVSGEVGHEEFTVLSSFSWGEREKDNPATVPVDTA